jgi:hypothetical protein
MVTETSSLPSTRRKRLREGANPQSVQALYMFSYSAMGNDDIARTDCTLHIYDI